ncbi:MAG: esterase EstD [Bacteroidota bacterium]
MQFVIRNPQFSNPQSLYSYKLSTMRLKVLLLVFHYFFIQSLFGQNVAGTWNGILNAGGTQLRLVLKIESVGKSWKGTLQSPDQSEKFMDCDKVEFKNNEFQFEINALKIAYSGILKNEILEGTFQQGGFKAPLSFSRNEVKKQELVRPQEPKAPFSYLEEEITFHQSKANFDLAGTLTRPKEGSSFPAVVLVSGSGPQDRNEEILGHKPFWVIADALTKSGVLVLRYDDRGVAKSKGDFSSATTRDLADDAAAAVAYLKSRKDVDASKISVLGHSEGAMIATILAAERNDLQSVILLAGPGIRGDSLLLLQQALIARAEGGSEKDIKVTKDFSTAFFKIIVEASNLEAAKSDGKKFLEKQAKKLSKKELKEVGGKDAFVQQNLDAFLSPWMFYFLRYDPVNDIRKIKCDVLALNGDKDLQVPSKENLSSFNNNLSSTIQRRNLYELKNMNHLFQPTNTGKISEYGSIETTISTEVLEILVDWFK